MVSCFSGGAESGEKKDAQLASQHDIQDLPSKTKVGSSPTFRQAMINLLTSLKKRRYSPPDVQDRVSR